jgi:hypothetical protein
MKGTKIETIADLTIVDAIVDLRHEAICLIFPYYITSRHTTKIKHYDKHNTIAFNRHCLLCHFFSIDRFF